MGTHPIFESDFDCLTESVMEHVAEWFSGKCLDFFALVGFSPPALGIGGFVFSISFLTILTTVHLTLWFIASNCCNGRQIRFKQMSEAKSREILKLMKQRIDLANSPDNAHQDCKTKSDELKRLEDELQRANRDKQNVELHSQEVQAQDAEYRTKLEQLQVQYQEAAQRCQWKEQELGQLQMSLSSKNASQDQTSQHLYAEKEKLSKMTKEVGQSKNNAKAISKQTDKLVKELENIHKQRAENQSIIDKLEENQKSLKCNQTEEEEVKSKLVLQRNQLEKALKELNSAGDDKLKETVINNFFDLDKATIRIDTAEREIANRQALLQEATVKLQEQVQKVQEADLADCKSKERCRSLDKQKRSLKMQLDVLKEFYAQHDVKVRQELAKEKEIRSSMAGDLATFADREKFMKGEIEEYKRVRLKLVKNQEEDRKNRTLMTNKVEREAHEFWLKLREAERAAKDLQREQDSLGKQLGAKEAKKASLENNIHKIQFKQEQKKAKERAERDRLLAERQHHMKLQRMRGPEGEKARERAARGLGIGHVPVRPTPVMHRMRHESPQLSPIQGSANRQNGAPRLAPPMPPFQQPGDMFQRAAAPPPMPGQPTMNPGFHPNVQYPPVRPQLMTNHALPQHQTPVQHQNQLHGTNSNQHGENHYMA